MRKMWWHFGPAHCKRICHVACKSGTEGMAFHNCASSLNVLFSSSCTNAAEPTGVPNTLMQVGFHTSGPNSAILVGHTDARFHTRVFPVWRRMPACVQFYAASVLVPHVGRGLRMLCTFFSIVLMGFLSRLSGHGTTCPTQSVPALVERANWNAAHA